MSSSLPRYLSVALGKRLNTKGVEVIPYAQVRYIGGPSTFAFLSTSNLNINESDEKNDSYYSSPKNAKIGIFLSRVYDSLHTNMLYTDKVALFPTSVPYANQGQNHCFFLIFHFISFCYLVDTSRKFRIKECCHHECIVNGFG